MVKVRLRSSCTKVAFGQGSGLALSSPSIVSFGPSVHSVRAFWDKPKKKKKPSPPRPKQELLSEAVHHDVPVRRKAMRGLGKHRDDADAIQALAKGLGDEDVAVQLSAQAAMSKVAEIGDERSVQACLELVSSSCEWTRIAALSTLADISGESGHPTRGTPLDIKVDAAVRGRLEDDDWGVRRAAMDTMAKRAPQNDEETLAAAKKLLEDQMGTVRESAIKAIAGLVPRGSKDAMDWIAPRLDDWHESVRRAAVIAVAKIAEKGDQHAIELETSSCDDRSWIVRKAATDSLAKTATLNDLPALRKLSRMLEDFDPLPRMAAIYGIAELCGVGHRKAIRLAEARLEHRDPGTRQACVQLLEKVATNDMPEIMKKVKARMDDEDEHVRDSAYYSLEAIKVNKPGRRKWKSDLPDLSNLDKLGFDSSSDEEEGDKKNQW
jgi:HEAT repeat protein